MNIHHGLTLLDLPFDITLHILRGFPLSELHLGFRRVSKKARAIVDDKRFWDLKLFSIRGEFPGRTCAGVAVLRDVLFILGGDRANKGDKIDDRFSDVWAFDFNKAKWGRFDLEVGLTEHSVVLYKDSLYVHAGVGASGYTNDSFRVPVYRKGDADIPAEVTFLEHLDVAIGKPQKLESKKGDIWPRVRGAHSAVVYKDSMHVLGGWAHHQTFFDHFYYEFETSKWKVAQVKGGEIPPPRRMHCAAVWQNCMYVFGGFANGSDPRSLDWSDVYEYNFDTQIWRKLARQGAIPPGRSRCTMVAHEGKLHVFGGTDRTEIFSDYYIYNIATETWTRSSLIIPASPAVNGIMFHTSTIWNNHMVMVGGQAIGQNLNLLHILRLA